MAEPLLPPLGAIVDLSGVAFGVWAPDEMRVELVLDSGNTYRLARSADGVHRTHVPGAGPGSRYKFRLDGGRSLPDPRSRFQPEGVHGWSEVVDPSAFSWTDDEWAGVSIDGLVIYELHVGTYTPAGTFAALIDELPELRRLGVTAIELMPVNDFPGQRNWGYDGVALWAPSRAYGRPDDLRRLVDAAHAEGLAVILDVVYNHVGPDGNYLSSYAKNYFSESHRTPWGEAVNFDGPESGFVRDFVTENAIHWVEEYHVDGFRIDAAERMIDTSSDHVLCELQRRVRAASTRPIVMIAEESRNDVRTIRAESAAGFEFDGVWADDFHHEMRVFLTGFRESHFANYEGTLSDVGRTIQGGFGFQGQVRPTTGKPRGTKVTDERAAQFVFCIQNHDQIGNRPFGDRLHHEIDLGRYAAASALLLLAPETPLLFQGQEFAAFSPFLFFTDHYPELGRLVRDGRRKEFAGFKGFDEAADRERIPDPQAEATFLASKLNLAEREANAGIYRLYQELLRLRRDDPVFARQDRRLTEVTTIDDDILVMRRWNRGGAQRLLIANFGSAIEVPLLDLAERLNIGGASWTLLLATTELQFDGSGDVATAKGNGLGGTLTLPARSATVWSGAKFAAIDQNALPMAAKSEGTQ